MTGDKRYYFPYGMFDGYNLGAVSSGDRENYPIIIYVCCDDVTATVSSLEGIFVTAIDLRGTPHNPVVERSQMGEFGKRNDGTFVDLVRQNSPTTWSERVAMINHSLHGGIR